MNHILAILKKWQYEIWVDCRKLTLKGDFTEYLAMYVQFYCKTLKGHLQNSYYWKIQTIIFLWFQKQFKNSHKSTMTVELFVDF